MKQKQAALVVASVAAPYIVSFFLFLLEVLPSMWDNLKASLAESVISTVLIVIAFSPAVVIGIVLNGAIGVIVFSIPLFLLSSLLIFLLDLMNWNSREGVIGSGALLGLGFMLALASEAVEQPLTSLFIGAFSGATCGWIYWRIATGGPPREPVT